MTNSQKCLRAVHQILQSGYLPVVRQKSDPAAYIGGWQGCALSQAFSPTQQLSLQMCPGMPFSQGLYNLGPLEDYDTAEGGIVQRGAASRAMHYFDSMTPEELVDFWPQLDVLLGEFYVARPAAQFAELLPISEEEFAIHG